MKRIGIIGAGQIGATLAKKFSQAGHAVRIANSRGPESLKELAIEANVTAVTLEQAVEDVDIVIVSIPFKSIKDLPANLFAETPGDLIIVDTGNYYPEYRETKIEAIENGMPETEWVSAHLHRPVLKAFNNIGATSLAKNSVPLGDPNRIALPVAGDSIESKTEIMTLINEIGFDAVDGGSLSESWKQQPGSPVYCTDHNKEEVLRLLQTVEKSKLPDLRGLGLKMVMELKDPANESRSVLRGLYKTGI
ncbi:NADPH-dependent F420 reductase [Sphingobacterium sp. MYb388]|uniref:NADPH-dependent F420 reductase n=1 Tax=Sphingobacterium sp. MYb388 TaxID=2745437 RepID=UPI0030A13536